MFLFAACGLVVYPAAIRAVAASRGGTVILAPLQALAPYAFALYLVHKPYFLSALSDRLLSRGRFADDYLVLMCTLFVVGGGTAIAAVVATDRVTRRFTSLILGVNKRVTERR